MDFQSLSDQFARQDVIEWAGLVTGILYVILATYERPSCWIFGILSSACIAWKSFTDYRLIADGALQLFYIGVGIVGLWMWMQGKQGDKPKPIVRSPWWHHALSVCIGLLLSWPVSWVLITYADARYGYIDTVLTVLSVWATWLLIRKDLHNWVYWIIIDILYVGLYWGSEGYLFAILFFIYTWIALWGWKRWSMQYQA